MTLSFWAAAAGLKCASVLTRLFDLAILLSISKHSGGDTPLSALKAEHIKSAYQAKRR
jgi:hypothetical protein